MPKHPSKHLPTGRSRNKKVRKGRGGAVKPKNSRPSRP
jgi:hypothetical protein